VPLSIALAGGTDTCSNLYMKVARSSAFGLPMVLELSCSWKKREGVVGLQGQTLVNVVHSVLMVVIEFALIFL